MNYAPRYLPMLHGFRLAFRAAGSGISGTESTGLWLIAVGAFLVALALLANGHLAGLSGRPVGPMGTRRDRIGYAVSAVGACLVAVGSGIVAVKSFPALWVVIVTVVVGVPAVWLFAAWRLLVDSKHAREGLETQTEETKDRPVLGEASPLLAGWRWDLKRYGGQANWGWCLRHAFSSEARAKADAEREHGPRP